MDYFKINGVDYSDCVCGLEVSRNAIYNSQTNCMGDTVVDYINSKREIDVDIISLDNNKTSEILNQINNVVVSITFLDPITKTMEEATCLIPKTKIKYYTIQQDNVRIDSFSLGFEEL